MFNLLSIPIVCGHNQHYHIPSRELLHIYSAAYQKKRYLPMFWKISLFGLCPSAISVSYNQSFTVFIVGILQTFGAILIENN
jgi:hypothetical protein